MSQSKRMLGFLAILFALSIIGLSRYREQRAYRGVSVSAVGDFAYQARLRDWRRDSTVLDSVTREVNTAKLYALYRQALGKEGVTLRLMTELGCEEVRLGIQYGEVAWQRASRAVRDTVYRDIGVSDGLNYIARHAPDEGVVETGENCRPLPPRAPQKLGETRLDVEFPRPRPGRKASSVSRDADSAVSASAYEARLRSWRRDSAVLDSASREVNTAALYSLYRQALPRNGVTLRLMSEMDCEYLRLTYHYGVVPAKHAVDAMRDTVYRDIGVTDALDYIARHAPAEGMIETGFNVCQPMPPPGPKTVGNTRLDVEYPRPRPPVRW